MAENRGNSKTVRTEDDKLTQASIKVIFGGKEYEVKPLVIRDSREWRAKVIKLIAPLPGLVSTTTNTPEDFGQVLTEMLVNMPDQVIELFFEYAKDLNKDEIESIATDKEMATAFEAVLQVAFPLAESAPGVLTRLYPAKTKRSR